MPVPPYIVTFQPSSSGTTLVSRVIVPHPSGGSGVHECPMVPVLKTYQSLGGPGRISSQRESPTPRATTTPPPGITNTLVLLSHIPATGNSRKGCQVTPLWQDLPQRLIVGSCPIDSTLTTHPRHTPRSPHSHYLVLPSLRHLVPFAYKSLPHQHHITDIMRVRVNQ
jgi:hypothetical protein